MTFTGDELRLGTRGSQLALWQAHAVANRLAESGGPPCRIVVIKTSGDRLQEAPLSDVGSKRLFVKEIEDALVRDEIDLAVHSSKDMPVVLPRGLAIAAVLPREDPRDAVVLPGEVHLKTSVDELANRGASSQTPAAGAVEPGEASKDIDDLVSLLGQSPSIGTGSVRRIAQLTRVFPGARFQPIRGNLDTRLKKLDRGEHDALVLAAAGLRRLGFESRISLLLPSSVSVPAPGQGIVAIEIREDDERVRRVVEGIGDRGAWAALSAERAVVETLGGGCQTPIGALATLVGTDEVEVNAVVVAVDGSRAVRATDHGSRIDAVAIGARVGAQLLAHGANEILDEARRSQGAVEGIQP